MRDKKTKLMLQVEEVTEKNLKELLIELYATMTFQDVVHFFKCNYGIDITISGLSRWFLKFNIPTREWRLPEVKANNTEVLNLKTIDELAKEDKAS